MEYKVVKSFIDRDTLAEVPAGAMYRCEDLVRVALLSERGYITALTAKQTKKKRSK